MSVKKSLGAYLPVFAVLVLVTAAVFLMNRPEDMNLHIAAGCSVKEYSMQRNTGYITLELDDAGNTMKKFRVEDKELQKELSEKNLSDIIGVNMLLTLPARIIKSAHIDLKNANPFELLSGTDAYDKYAVVTGVSCWTHKNG